MIGATTSQTLDLTLLNKGDIVYGTSTIKVEIGLKIGSTIEYIPLGIYNIDDIEKTDYTIKITAFDNMMKFERNFSTTLGDILTLQQVVSELNRITGVEFTGTLPAYTVKKLEGFSCREVLGYVASICGGNAVITRDGKLTIVTPKDVNYSIGTSNYFDYKREETKYKIGKISCQVGEEVLSKGSLGADSMELEFENPWITTAILNDIYTKLNGFEYLGYSMKWQGDLSLGVGDIVTITDKKGVVRKHPILSQKFTYTGGLTSEIGAKGETKNKNSFSSSGSTAKKIERAVMELAIINKALIDVAYIGDLTAGNIKFDTASGTILDLQTLLSKFITGENGQFINLTTDNVTISNAVIKDIIAKNISVEDLKASTISTNKFKIASDNGGIEIVGATQQFKDKNNKVRIQMGQDTQGNFNFILRGEDGTTTLIDHTGIKEKAIADKLIKSNMVADNAIGEQQINYSSLVTGLNKDTNTSLIQASKVAIDLTGQSLDVAFNSLKSSVNGFDERIEANTTSISIAQGNIEGIIKESAITKSDVTTLKDNYTSIKATVDGINTTVASHTSSIGSLNTDISGLSGKVTIVENNYSSLSQDLSGFKTTVSNTYSTKTELSGVDGKVTSLTSRVNTVEQNITSTAITTTISSAINSGTSSITTTQFVMDKTGLTIKNGALTIKNKAGTNVLTGDTNGNLTITGNFTTTSSGKKAIELISQSINLYDWEGTTRTTPVGTILSGRRIINGSTSSIPGFVVANEKSAYLSLAYRNGSGYTDYILLDKDGMAGQGSSFPIWVQENCIFNSSFIGIRNPTTSSYNRMFLSDNSVLVTEISTAGVGHGWQIQTTTGTILPGIRAGQSYPINLGTNTYIYGNLAASGSKNSLQYTQNYGERLINAYETAEYYFGDIGSGVIKEGECIVWIDDILQECINTNVEYHVFTQVYNGNITKIERFKDYFIVYGEDNTKFSWEIKAKRIGYENIRLDSPDIGTVEEYAILDGEDLEAKTTEDILLNILTFDLENFLLEG